MSVRGLHENETYTFDSGTIIIIYHHQFFHSLDYDEKQLKVVR